MKRYDESIIVHTDEQGLPQRLHWRNRLYRVTHVEEEWRYAGKWWLGGGSWQRRYFRVAVRGAHNSQLCEMQLYRQGRVWTLGGVYD